MKATATAEWDGGCEEIASATSLKGKVLSRIATLATLAAQTQAGIVANTIYAESRGESKAGRYAVASVIWNRHKASGKSLEAVCLAHKQFSCFNNGVYRPEPIDEREAAILAEFEAWEGLMKAGRFIPSLEADHYCRVDCFPYWRNGLTNTKIIGAHLFGCCN